MRMYLKLLAACSWCCLACGETRPDSSSASVSLAAVRTLEVTEDLRIDGMAADLVPVEGLTVAANGTVAIVQNMDHAIRFFNAAGSDLGSLGGRGQGPGEFARIARIGWLADTLWVLDASLQRVTLIRPDRSFDRTFPLRPEPGVPGGPEPILPLLPFALYSDRAFLAVALVDPVRATIVRANFDTDALDVLAVFQEHAPNFGLMTIGGQTLSANLIPTIPLFAVSPGGEFFALARVDDARPVEAASDAARRSDTAVGFQVTLINSIGDTLYHRTIEVAGEAISDGVIDSIMARRTRGMSRADIASYRSRVSIPPFWPPALSMVIGDDGRAWLQLRASESAPTYLVLDKQGLAGGSLVLPANTLLAFADGQSIWCLEKDANDIQSVVRYRVQ